MISNFFFNIDIFFGLILQLPGGQPEDFSVSFSKALHSPLCDHVLYFNVGPRISETFVIMLVRAVINKVLCKNLRVMQLNLTPSFRNISNSNKRSSFR